MKKRSTFLADPGKARGGWLYKHLASLVIHSFIHPLVKISLRRRHPKTVNNGAFSHETNYINIFSEILNLEGHLNRCIDSKVTAIWLNGWILPTGGVALGRVCTAACAAGLFMNQ